MTVAVLGDIVIDVRIEGDVNRIAPEAATPVLLLRHISENLGAAGNVAANVAALSGKVSFFSVVGSNARFKLEALRERKPEIKTEFVFCDSLFTPIKTRIISGFCQFIRVDEEFSGRVASPARVSDLLSMFEKQVEAGSIKLAAVSDYAKGMFDDKSATRLLDCARAHGVPVFADVKPRVFERWVRADLITPNRQEMLDIAVIAGLHSTAEHTGDLEVDSQQAAIKVLSAYPLKHIVLTQSENGASLFSKRDSQISRYHTVANPIGVYDVTGAGDVLLAALAVGAEQGMTLEESLYRANWAACLSVQKRGVCVIHRHEWADAVMLSRGWSGKILGGEGARQYADRKREAKQKIVLTNGCFDSFHAGHMQSLLWARAQGDVLIVAVDSDASVRKLKGEGRPVVSECYRAAQLAAQGCVDAVIVFDGNIEEIVKSVLPDVLVKGEEYRDKAVLGASLVEGYGGKVMFSPQLPNVSTTRLVTIGAGA